MVTYICTLDWLEEQVLSLESPDWLEISIPVSRVVNIAALKRILLGLTTLSTHTHGVVEIAIMPRRSTHESLCFLSMGVAIADRLVVAIIYDTDSPVTLL